MGHPEDKKGDEQDVDPAGETASVTSAGSSSTDLAGVAKATSTFSDKISAAVTTAKANAAPVALGVALAEAEEGANEIKTPVVKPEEPVEHTTLSRAGGGAGAAIAALGIYNGTKEFLVARKEGNVAKEVVSATDASMGFVNLGIQTAGALGHEVSPLLDGGAKIGGTVVLVAQAGLNIYEAKGNFLDRDIHGHVTGLGNKGEVTIKEGVKIGTGLGVAAVVGSAVAAAGIVGITAVALPVVVAGAAVYAVDKVATAAIDANNAWKDLDKQIEQNGAARRIGSQANGVSINRYAHIVSQTINASADIRDDHIVGGTLERKNGRILPTPANAKILSDPRNLPEISQALDKRINVATKAMKDNDQALPVILRWTSSSQAKTDRYETAKADLANAQGAKAEIGMYRQDLTAYNATHPAQPAAAVAPQKPAPPHASPADIKAVQTELARRGLYEGPVNGKWNKETNEGLNKMIAAAQAEGKQAGIYKGALDNKYGNGTAQVFAASAATKTPQAVNPAFVKALNDMYTTGALQTVYKPEHPHAVVAPTQTVTVEAKAAPVPVEQSTVTASLVKPELPTSEPPAVEASTRTTGSAARDLDGNRDFDVASIKPVFTAAANGVVPQDPTPAPTGPVVAQRNNLGAPQNA